MKKCDVIVIGAGAAGLAAAVQLSNAGQSSVILEARDRIGGRIFTKYDADLAAPIELGAEFIHGKPPEIWDLLKAVHEPIAELEGDSWCSDHDSVYPCNFFGLVEDVLKKMDKSAPDESFLAFLDRCWKNPTADPKREEARQRSIAYVSGFNAADPGLVGVHWLVKGMEAEEKNGDRVFRSELGYEKLIEIFKQQLAQVPIELQAIVTAIRWKPGSVEVSGRGAKGEFTIEGRKVLVTVPLAVLQSKAGESGAIEFQPSLPAEKLSALEKLEMGKVIRVVLRFRHRFWDNLQPIEGHGRTLSRMSFLFTKDDWFPTWWTTMPSKLPIITGWAPFQSAERLSNQSEQFVLERALSSLPTVLGVAEDLVKREFLGGYFHDWQSDPFSRGAYSYGKVGSDGAQQALADPIAGTLFFAGEATDTTGNNGTVHGAMSSGVRAAAQILGVIRH